MNYLKTRRDRNHTEVKRWLEIHGIEVLETMKPLDLLCRRKGCGTVAFLEVKMPGSQAKYTRVQLSFIAHTRFNVVFATSADEALTKLREKQFLTQMNKDGIAGMLAFSDKKFFTPAELLKAIGKTV